MPVSPDRAEHHPAAAADFVLDGVSFAAGSAVLTREARVQLEEIAAWAAGEPGTIEIRGYTDDTGNPDSNRALSLRRALAGRVPGAVLDQRLRGQQMPDWYEQIRGEEVQAFARNDIFNRLIEDKWRRFGRSRNKHYHRFLDQAVECVENVLAFAAANTSRARLELFRGDPKVGSASGAARQHRWSATLLSGRPKGPPSRRTQPSCSAPTCSASQGA